MNKFEHINPANGRLWHYLHIEGSWILPCSITPVGPDGTAWSAPEDKHGHAFTVLPVFDDRDGIQAGKETWNPKDGVSAGGTMKFRLRGTDALLQHFASKLAGGLVATLASTVGHDTVDTGEDRHQVEVFEDISAWPSTGRLCINRETLHYPEKTDGSKRFGDDSDFDAYCDRGCYNWQDDSELDQRHLTHDGTTQLPLYVRNYPATWKGRRVTLFQNMCGPDGRCLDADWRGDHEIEVWSGWITGVDPTAAGDYTAIQINCSSLAQGLLKRQLGREKTTCLMGQEGANPSVDCNTNATTIRRVAVTYESSSVSQTRDYLENVRVTADGASSSAPMSGRVYLRHYGPAVAKSIAQAIEDILGGSGVAGALSVTATITGTSALPPVDGGEVPQRETALSFSVDDLPDGVDAQIQVGITWGTGVREALHFPRNDELSLWTREGGKIEASSPSWDARVDVPSYTSRIPCFTDPDASEEFPAGPAHALIEWTDDDSNDHAEIISYQEKSTTGRATGFDLLGCKRALMGTSATSYRLLPGLNVSGAPKLTAIWGWDEVPVADVILGLLTSTGGGHHGAYDTLDRTSGLAVDPAAIDFNSFEVLNQEPYALRTMALHKPTKFKDLVAKNCVFHGYVFGGRTGRDGRYRLAVMPVPQPTQTSNYLSLSEGVDGGIVRKDPTLRSSEDVYTQIQVQTKYDAVKGEMTGNPVTINYHNGVEQYGEINALEIEVPGVATDDLVGAAEYTSERLFALWGQQFPIIKLWADRRGLVLSPGDAIEVTVGGIPNTTGGRGLVEQPAVVLSDNKLSFKPDSAHAVELEAILFPLFLGMAPNWQVTAYDAATPYIDVADNVFTLKGHPSPLGEHECHDWHYGPGNGETWACVIYNLGDYEARESVLITGTSTEGRYLLNTTLTLTVGSNTVMAMADWGTSGRHADQDKFTHIADEDGLLGGSTTGHEWSL